METTPNGFHPRWKWWFCPAFFGEGKKKLKKITTLATRWPYITQLAMGRTLESATFIFRWSITSSLKVFAQKGRSMRPHLVTKETTRSNVKKREETSSNRKKRLRWTMDHDHDPPRPTTSNNNQEQQEQQEQEDPRIRQEAFRSTPATSNSHKWKV